MGFGSVYPAYVAKAERKDRTRAEVDEIIRWLTGYDQSALEPRIEDGTDFEHFFAQAPAMNPAREKIKGVQAKQAAVNGELDKANSMLKRMGKWWNRI